MENENKNSEVQENNELILNLLGMDPNEPPCEPRCNNEYCAACAMAECPYHEPLHRHHDGCPACYLEEIEKEKK